MVGFYASLHRQFCFAVSMEDPYIEEAYHNLEMLSNYHAICSELK